MADETLKNMWLTKNFSNSSDKSQQLYLIDDYIWLFHIQQLNTGVKT